MDLSAKVLHKAALLGFKRLRNFRRARKMFIQAFAGQYYDRDHGGLGDEPLALAFNAIRVLVPTLVTRNPGVVVGSEILAYRQYGEILGMAIERLNKKLDLAETMQIGIVDSIFTLGIFKVSLVATNSLVYFGDEGIDPGEIQVSTVDFDNLTFDPSTRQLRYSPFMGERIQVERDRVMDSGLYRNDLVERLPSSAAMVTMDRNVRDLSATQVNPQELRKLHDFVDMVELYLPGQDALVTVPYKSTIGSKFLREESFYGPEEGPYVFMRLTPPVPDNPLPVALAGVWHDLHVIGNKMAKKAADQALAQKDVLGYRPANADDAIEIVESENLQSIRMDDPSAAQMFSYGGQNPKNERFIAQVELWFNQMSGNTNLTGGLGIDANSATEANILNQNAATGSTYMKTQVNKAVEAILRREAWYLHTDPLIQIPLIRRESIPAEFSIEADGIKMIRAPQVNEEQIFLTPEVRRGDFLDFAFTIKEDSMAPINWQFRIAQLEKFVITIIPAAANAAITAAQLGQPFSFRRFVTKVGKLMGLEWLDEIWDDPELVNVMAIMMQNGPQAQNSKGVTSQGALNQNGGNIFGKKPASQPKQQRRQAQTGANERQADLPVRGNTHHG